MDMNKKCRTERVILDATHLVSAVVAELDHA